MKGIRSIQNKTNSIPKVALRLYKIPWMLLLCAFLISVPFAVFCQGKSKSDNLEIQVKAAYIYNFTKFITWDSKERSSSKKPTTICLFGSDTYCDLLEDFLNSQVAGQSIIIKRVNKKVSEITGSQMVFISRAEQQKMPTILRQVEGSQVLTVSDIPGFARHGGMIGFVIENGRIKIEMNLNAAKKAGLNISAKLLEVARIVSNED